MRPRSSPPRRSIFICQSREIHSGCSITKRYISATHSAPSGPVRTLTGRDQLSVEARNSRSRSSSARRDVKVDPFGFRICRFDQIVNRLTHEGVPVVLFTQKLIPVNRRPTNGCKSIGPVGLVESFHRLAGRENGERHPVQQEHRLLPKALVRVGFVSVVHSEAESARADCCCCSQTNSPNHPETVRTAFGPTAVHEIE